MLPFITFALPDARRSRLIFRHQFEGLLHVNISFPYLVQLFNAHITSTRFINLIDK